MNRSLQFGVGVFVVLTFNVAAFARPTLAAGLEQTTRTFLETLNSSGGKPMEELTPEEARKVLEGAQSAANVKLPPCEVSDKTISVEDMTIRLYVVKPNGATGTLPVFMFFHGGGWVLGDFATHERFVRDLVVESGAACVFVEYSRSPEAMFPTALNESYAATKWVSEHGAEIGVDGSRLAVVGNSAGGNITAAVTLMAKEKGGPAIRYQVLFWPVTDADFNTDSYRSYKDGHFLTRNMMKWFWDSYVDKKERGNILASPLQASTDQLRGLPPALIQTAEHDVLRDEGEAYAHKLMNAGVEVTAVRYLGMIHDYGLLNALSDVPAVRAALRQAGLELRLRLRD